LAVSRRISCGVIGEGLGLTAGGLALGLGTGVLLGQAMKDLLFQIEPTDPLTYGVIAIAMGAVALLAAVGPARRAAKVAPMEVLRG
jgi:putative ABC transport system permease protein